MLRKVNTIIAHLYLTQTRKKKGVRPSALLALLTLLIFGGFTVGTGNGQSINAVSTASDLKVMTWNIHGGQRVGPGCHATIPCQLNQTVKYLPHVLDEINRHEGLDVIALQEIYRSQAVSLAQNLAITHGFHPRPYFVETRSCGATGASNNDFGIAIISRHPFIDVDRVNLDKDNLFLVGREMRMLARVIIRVGGRRVYVYNTHLAPNDFLRIREVPRLREQVFKDKGNQRDFRPVLMGDFNAQPGSNTYRDIREGLFLDAWRETHTRECTPFSRGSDNGCTFDTFAPDTRIDYILPGSGGVFRVDFAQVTSNRSLFDVFGLGRTPNARTDCNKVPDHLPVVAHLSYRDN